MRIRMTIEKEAFTEDTSYSIELQHNIRYIIHRNLPKKKKKEEPPKITRAAPPSNVYCKKNLRSASSPVYTR